MSNYNNWRTDMSASVKAVNKIKDSILASLLNGKIHSVEGKSDEISMLIDKKSGIDYLFDDDAGTKGIAARVQFGNPYNTFTIRSKRHSGAETEYSKRVNQIKNGYLYPHYTFQAYFDDRERLNLLTIGIARTIDIYQFIDAYPSLVGSNRSDNEFKFVSFHNLSLKYQIVFYADERIYGLTAGAVLNYRNLYPHLACCPITESPYSFVDRSWCGRCYVVNCGERGRK